MITWTVSPENHKAAVKRFIKGGAPLPKGMKSLGRWHTAGSTRGFHLVEGSEAAIAEDVGVGDAVEELEGFLALRGVQPSLEHDLARSTATDFEHPCYLKAMVNVMVLRRSANS
jgi:hypothetical protein